MNLSWLSPKGHLLTWISALIALSLCIALIIAVAQGPDRGRIFLEALKLIISWPLAICLLSFAFGIAFNSELKRLINGISEIWLPGGSRILTQQHLEKGINEEVKLPDDEISLNNQAKPIEIAEIQKKLKDPAEARKVFDNMEPAAKFMLFQKSMEAKVNFYKYLAAAFVPITKIILYWFGNEALGVTKEVYMQNWGPKVSTIESETIFLVLLQHKLIEPKDTLYKITPLGMDFIKFMEGRWPPPRHE